MLNANELRTGNWVLNDGKPVQLDIDMLAEIVGGWQQIEGDPYHPIPLSPEVLYSCGAINTTILNPFFSSFDFPMPNGPVMSVANPGTPNEFVFLTELNVDNTQTVITLRNFDYHGETYLHDLQNIYQSISKTELTYKP